jgi:hypothetical protein
MTSARFMLVCTSLLLAACAAPRRGLASVDDSDQTPGRFDGRYETIVKRCGIAGDLTQVTRDVIEVNARKRANLSVNFETAHSRLEETPAATLTISRRNFTFDQRVGECPHVVTSGRVEDDGRDAALVPATRQGCEGPAAAVDGESAAPIAFTDGLLVETRPGDDCPSDRVAQRLWRHANP